MKYLKLFESFNEKELREICIKHKIYDYTINPDGSIDSSYVDLYEKGLKKLPIKFNKVKGYFSCTYNELMSFEGFPVEITGNLSCHSNQLTSFKYAPKIIDGYFDCRYNKINSFEYFPSYVGNWLHCECNPIYEVWDLFYDITKIELLNDFDIFRDEDTDTPGIVMDRLYDFLSTIGKEPVDSIKRYKNI